MVVGNVEKGSESYTGLPVGVQIVAAPFKDELCLAAANYLANKLPVESFE